MNCREYRGGLTELGRGRTPGEASRRVLMSHLDVCEECVRFLEAQRALTAAMGGLAAEEIPSADEFAAPVMAEFDQVHLPLVHPALVPARRRARVVAIRWAAVAGLAAAACLAVIVIHRPAPVARPVAAVPPVTAPTAAMSTQPPRFSTPVKPATRVKQSSSRPAAREAEEPFYPIPYTVPLGPGEWARVERMQIPVAALIAAGFHMQAMDPTATVEADVLVSQDGRARAIRPVSISSSN
jgi:hypothetical protein